MRPRDAETPRELALQNAALNIVLKAKCPDFFALATESKGNTGFRFLIYDRLRPGTVDQALEKIQPGTWLSRHRFGRHRLGRSASHYHALPCSRAESQRANRKVRRNANLYPRARNWYPADETLEQEAPHDICTSWCKASYPGITNARRDSRSGT